MGNKIKRPAGAHMKYRFMPINVIPNGFRWQTCKPVALFNRSMHMLDEKNVNSLTECKYGSSCLFEQSTSDTELLWSLYWRISF